MKKRSVIITAIFVALVVSSVAIVLGTGMLQPSIAEKTDSTVSSQVSNEENSENSENPTETSLEAESSIVESENTSDVLEISEKNEPSSMESSDSNSSSNSSSKPSGSNGSSSGSSSSSNNISGSSSSSSSNSTSSSSSNGSGSSYKPSGNGGNSGSSKPSHSHSYSSKTVKATCTSDGYTIHTCSCGDNYTDSYTNATGHKWSDWKTVKKATTSSEGKKQRTCSSCGKTESKFIAKLQSSLSSGEHRITGARKAVYSYNGSHGDKWSSVNLVDLINEERAKEGLGKLEWTADGLSRSVKADPELLECYDSDCFDSNGKFNPYLVAEVREPLEGAQKMANWGYATHGGGVGCSCVGESWGNYTIEEALREHIKGYMESAPHRATLMNPGSHRVTAAYAIGSDGTVYTAILVSGKMSY